VGSAVGEVVVGMGGVSGVGLVHMFGHSFAKASLFMCVGILLHGS